MSPNDMAKRLERRLAAYSEREQHHLFVEKLYEVAYAMPLPLEKIAVEMTYAIGEIYEGVSPEQLSLRLIDRNEFLRAIKRA